MPEQEADERALGIKRAILRRHGRRDPISGLVDSPSAEVVAAVSTAELARVGGEGFQLGQQASPEAKPARTIAHPRAFDLRRLPGHVLHRPAPDRLGTDIRRFE